MPLNTNPLVTIVGNGIGSFFSRCHHCLKISPPHAKPDDLRILTEAKAAGWKAVRVGDQYRLFCSRPTCQKQAG